jgi:hypothetical protein
MGVDHTMRADGKTADHVERAVAFVKALHEAAMRGDDYATVSSAPRRYLRRRNSDHHPSRVHLLGSRSTVA